MSKGRKRIEFKEKEKALRVFKSYEAGAISLREGAKILGCSFSTFSRRVKERKELLN